MPDHSEGAAQTAKPVGFGIKWSSGYVGEFTKDRDGLEERVGWINGGLLPDERAAVVVPLYDHAAPCSCAPLRERIEELEAQDEEVRAALGSPSGTTLDGANIISEGLAEAHEHIEELQRQLADQGARIEALTRDAELLDAFERAAIRHLDARQFVWDWVVGVECDAVNGCVTWRSPFGNSDSLRGLFARAALSAPASPPDTETT